MPRVPRDYAQEYQDYQGTPTQIKRRSERNKARRKLGLKPGDNKEVDHRQPLSKGGSNSQTNLRVTSQAINRHKYNK